MVTVKRLRELLIYNPQTGELHRKVTISPAHKAGMLAGSINAVSGYREVWLERRLYYAHRLAWLYVYGHWPCAGIDHINGIRDDNRLCNLREADKQVNGLNRHRANRNSRTGWLGVVYLEKVGAYRAEIKIAGKSKYLGQYPTAQEAHTAYMAAKRRYQRS